MSGAENLITPNGAQRIQNELGWLKSVERPRIVAEVSWAASLGDRSENAEYIYGKRRLREIDSRVGYLLKCLDKARVSDPGLGSGSLVRFGATVVVEEHNGEQRTWRIYGEHEVDVTAGVISHRSPLAKALLGRSEGDTVSYHTPGGAREVEIVSVSYEAQVPLPEPEWRQG